MSKNNSTISVPNPKLRVICPISVIIASKDLDLERVSSAWLGSAEQGTNDKEWVMEPARKMCRTKNDNENLTLKHISFTFCSLFRVEIIKTSNKLTVFDIQWLHFVGRGAFPNARPRRLSADVCVLELEDNNPKTPKRSKTFAVFPFFASPKKPRVFFFGFLPKAGGWRTKFPAKRQDGRLCFCFAFGCIVCWGFTSMEVRRLKRLIRKSIGVIQLGGTGGCWDREI